YDTTGMPQMGGFNGRWIELPGRVSMRMLNPKIAEISSAFARRFRLTSGQLEVDSSLSLFDNSIGYCFFDRATTNQDIVSKILWILSTHDITVADTVVLGQTVDLLRELDYIYRQATQSDTKRTFESQETYNQLTGSDNRYPIDADLKKIRRVCKVHFTTLGDCMKFATIQSFKGWEADTVILIIEAGWASPSAQSCHAMIYTALTRARKNLFIINKGNNIYDRFFRGQILEE
ncbi:MAG: ATP-binding domain-containing protein, partial [Allobaculum sp.]|nr:ATP-binding domain-containing protein [Allobaculum sp.]